MQSGDNFSMLHSLADKLGAAVGLAGHTLLIVMLIR
jgi:electron transfer flavoprotein alpha subunit